MDNLEDNKLAELLKQGAHDPGENPWFTRRLLNKLPERHERGSWLMPVLYAVAIIACCLCWFMMLRSHDQGAITVRDVLYNATMGVMMLFLLWQEVVSLIRLADV